MSTPTDPILLATGTSPVAGASRAPSPIFTIGGTSIAENGDRFEFDFKELGDHLSDKPDDLWNVVRGKRHWSFPCDEDADVIGRPVDEGPTVPVDPGSGEPTGTTPPSSTLSLVTPTSPTLASYTVAGPTVWGTASADVINVGPQATDVFGAAGNDVLIWDQNRGGGLAREVDLNGGGADTYRIKFHADPAKAAALPGCVIIGFEGPGVSSRDKAQLLNLDTDTLDVTALADGYLRFHDRPYDVTLGFHDPDHNPVPLDMVAQSVFVGPGNELLADFLPLL